MAVKKDELRSGATNPSERHQNAIDELANLGKAAQKPAPQVEAPPKPVDKPEEPVIKELPIDEPNTSFFKNTAVDKEEAAVELPVKIDGVPVTPEEKRIIKKIKAAGKEHEVDMSDDEAVTRLLQKGIGADKAFTDADKYEKEVPALLERMKELEKYKAVVDYLEEAKEDDDELFRRVSGGRELKSAFQKHQDHEAWLATADKTEIDNWKMKQRLATLEKQNELTAKQKQDALAQLDKRDYETNKNAIKTSLMSELKRVSFSGTLGDPIEEADLDDMMHMKAMKSVKAYVKNNKGVKEIPNEVIREAYDLAKKRLARMNVEAVNTEVETITKKRSEEATKQAALASTRNYKTDKDLIKEIRKAGGRPTDLFKTLWKK